MLEGGRPLHRLAVIAALAFILYPSLAGAKRNPIPCIADPYLDPKHDWCNPLRYIASNTLTAIAFSLILFVGIAQSWLTYSVGAKYMLSMVIGCYTFALGIGLRFGLHIHPQSSGIYIAEYLFVVLSPCAFIAATYVLLGRLARYIDCDEHLAVNPRRITVAFLCSDITTFLIQAAGGGVSSSARDDHTARTGSRIFLAGLAAQLVSFVFFSTIYLLFLYRVYTRRRDIWTIDTLKPWYKDWRALAGALIISCIGILIRSVYRTIELSEGFAGPLATSEPLFYGLDTLPLFIAIVIFIPFWPGRFISSTPITRLSTRDSQAEKQESGSNNSSEHS